MQRKRLPLLLLTGILRYLVSCSDVTSYGREDITDSTIRTGPEPK